MERIPEQIDRYRVHGVAGVGGMGTVLRATDTVLERDVALKVIGVGLDDAERQRLSREAKHLAALQHPNVVDVYDAGEADGVAYVAMRWVNGPNLTEVVRGGGPLELERALRLVSQVASALDAAHARDLVHRDVKPSNILLCRDDDRALLADFGTTIQQDATHGVTASGSIVATADFAAPEQIEARALDGRTDVYALGCVAYFLLAGRVPFPRESVTAKLWAHVNEPAPSLPGVPAHVDAAIRRAMAKDPGERFASAGEFAAALAAPVAAEAPRRRRRAPVLAAVAAMLVVVLAAGMMLTPDDSGAPVGAAKAKSEPAKEPKKPKKKKKKRRAKREKRVTTVAPAATATPVATTAPAPAATPEPAASPEKPEKTPTPEPEPEKTPEPEPEAEEDVEELEEFEEFEEPEPEPTPAPE